MSERKHLTQSEVAKLMDAIKGATHEVRDRCLVLLMYRHGLRVSEACGLKLSQVDLDDGVLHVQRLKGGLSTTHPLRSDEMKALRAWLAVRGRMAPGCDALFVSNRRMPINRRTVWVALRGYGEKAGLLVEAHPHMLRHACGYALADRGADTRLIQDYLGHRNIQHTVRYTATNPARFEKLWR
ncbi:tyrosine-type recombinase/integrase [Comamonas testosteroni]|uniref:tyrosine-type recombinase/integrase n=1 Tax=Comamonas testosteroni TaxID=285 RepID=UPI00265F9DE4|nr:tyrosine-type recombinase/integrase [Comamonas testosteroni]WKL14384.1 tyrosine-type recombinase/integrase [Comamonas testosteroni]